MGLLRTEQNQAREKWAKNRTVPVAAAIAKMRKTIVENGCTRSQIPADPMAIGQRKADRKVQSYGAGNPLAGTIGPEGCTSICSKSGKATPAPNPVTARIQPGDDHSEKKFPSPSTARGSSSMIGRAA